MDHTTARDAHEPGGARGPKGSTGGLPARPRSTPSEALCPTGPGFVYGWQSSEIRTGNDVFVAALPTAARIMPLEKKKRVSSGRHRFTDAYTRWPQGSCPDPPFAPGSAGGCAESTRVECPKRSHRAPDARSGLGRASAALVRYGPAKHRVGPGVPGQARAEPRRAVVDQGSGVKVMPATTHLPLCPPPTP